LNIMDIFVLCIVVLAGIMAGFIGPTVGGAGLILIPVLIFLGLEPHVAIATSTFSYLGIILFGLRGFHKSKKINYQLAIPIAVIATISSFLGASFLLNFDKILLSQLSGVIILLLLFLVIINKNIGVNTVRKLGKRDKIIGFFLFLLLGLWIGFFGAGWAIFASYILIFFMGQSFLEAAATRKIIALGAVGIAALTFAFAGVINWEFALPLIFAASMGSIAGTSYALKKGDAWVRNLFILVVLISALSLLF